SSATRTLSGSIFRRTVVLDANILFSLRDPVAGNERFHRTGLLVRQTKARSGPRSHESWRGTLSGDRRCVCNLEWERSRSVAQTGHEVGASDATSKHAGEPR